MIRFCGKVTLDYINEVVKLRGRQFAAYFISLGVVMEIIGIIIAVCTHSQEDLFTFICYGVIILILAVIIAVSVIVKKNFIQWNYDIIFGSDVIKVISNHQNGVTTETPIKKIKKVVDNGGYYLLYVSRFDASISIICQKDLLIDGSLEEFEKLFEGKLVRK